MEATPLGGARSDSDTDSKSHYLNSTSLASVLFLGSLPLYCTCHFHLHVLILPYYTPRLSTRYVISFYLPGSLLASQVDGWHDGQIAWRGGTVRTARRCLVH